MESGRGQKWILVDVRRWAVVSVCWFMAVDFYGGAAHLALSIAREDVPECVQSSGRHRSEGWV